MQRRAFTLIELLVVIGIIVLLVGILIPTLGAVYTRGYKTRTQGTMNDLQAALATYYSHFHAYPGPATAAQTTTGSGLSGAQNLYNGLIGGLDKSVVNPDGSNPKLPPFISVMAPGGGKNANVSVAPVVFIDAYSDSLPILYYRRTPGANVTSATAPTATATAAYYLNENSEYTGTTLTAIDPVTGSARSGGQTYDQTTGGLGGGGGVSYLGKLVSSDGTATGPPHGGYMLLSAGTDRIYGTSDDIVMVAGD